MERRTTPQDPSDVPIPQTGSEKDSKGSKDSEPSTEATSAKKETLESSEQPSTSTSLTKAEGAAAEEGSEAKEAQVEEERAEKPESKPYFIDYTRPKRGRKRAKPPPAQSSPSSLSGKSDIKDQSTDSKILDTSGESGTTNPDIVLKVEEEQPTTPIRDQPGTETYSDGSKIRILVRTDSNRPVESVGISDSPELRTSEGRDLKCLTEALEKIVPESSEENIKADYVKRLETFEAESSGAEDISVTEAKDYEIDIRKLKGTSSQDLETALQTVEQITREEIYRKSSSVVSQIANEPIKLEKDSFREKGFLFESSLPSAQTFPQQSALDSYKPESTRKQSGSGGDLSLDINKYFKAIDLKHFNSMQKSFDEDETLVFGKIILKSANASGFFCKECGVLYRPNNLPYKLTCGHNVCGNCMESKKEIFCEICTMGNIKVEGENLPSPSRDVFRLSMLLSNAIVAAESLKRETKNVKYLRRADLMLLGLEKMFLKANSSIEVITLLQQFVESRIRVVRAGFKLITHATDQLMKGRPASSMYIPSGIINSIKNFSNFTTAFITMLKEMDKLTIYTLQEPHLAPKDSRNIIVHEAKLSKEVIRTMQSSKTVVFALKETINGTLFSKVRFSRGRIFVHSLTKDLNVDEAHVIQYSNLHDNCIPYGVFFSLEFGPNIVRSIYFEIYDSSLLAQQIYLLCNGEYGATYKGGSGILTDDHIIIESYIHEEKSCYNDFLNGVPDNPGNYESPDQESVYNTRVYGKEAQIVINRHSERTPEFCIGKLLFGYPSRLPTGKFQINDCGIMFSFPEFKKAET